MSFIDCNGLTNSNKFRSFDFSKSTLSIWTNEWMKPKIEEGIVKNDDELLISFLEYSSLLKVQNHFQ